MPRANKRNATPANRGNSDGVKRGRKPIFTEEQKRMIERMIKDALREQLKNLAKSL